MYSQTLLYTTSSILFVLLNLALMCGRLLVCEPQIGWEVLLPVRDFGSYVLDVETLNVDTEH